MLNNVRIKFNCDTVLKIKLYEVGGPVDLTEGAGGKPKKKSAPKDDEFGADLVHNQLIYTNYSNKNIIENINFKSVRTTNFISIINLKVPDIGFVQPSMELNLECAALQEYIINF